MDLGQQVATEPRYVSENLRALLLEKYGKQYYDECNPHDVVGRFESTTNSLDTLLTRHGTQITVSEIVQAEREMRRRAQLPNMKDLRQWLLIAQQARRELEKQEHDPELVVSEKILCMGLRLWAHYRTFKVTDIQASYCV